MICIAGTVTASLLKVVQSVVLRYFSAHHDYKEFSFCQLDQSDYSPLIILICYQKCRFKSSKARGFICRSASVPTVQIHTGALSPPMCLHTSQSEAVEAAGVPVRILQDTAGCFVNSVYGHDSNCKATSQSFEASCKQCSNIHNLVYFTVAAVLGARDFCVWQ